MPQRSRQEVVQSLLRELKSLEALKKLFWEELNYDASNIPLGVSRFPKELADEIGTNPIVLATGGKDKAFHVLYLPLKNASLSRSVERQAIDLLLKDHPYALFIFANKDLTSWHFVNVKLEANVKRRRVIRRISIAPHLGLRTATERLQMLDLASMSQDMFGPSELTALQIQSRHDLAFEVESVTKEFYKEIANWYFWARDVAEFPKEALLDAENKPSLHVIRLITRLMFCWFLREKRNPAENAGLIPDDLFNSRAISKLLKDPSPKASTYYLAILQNLFFATLNTEMDEPGKPINRRFINEGDGRTSDDHMIHTVWRHEKLLTDPNKLAEMLRRVPFLNGGLFECLDDRLPGPNGKGTIEKRIDGFSSKSEKQPKLPNYLFFGFVQDDVNLSSAYGDPNRDHETVRPLLDILNRYNFTLTENTPLEQEVALDPELLGHVFENLLAAYNPETGTIARKATGSFYTPRVVVDWMVDQALVSYLAGSLGITDEGRSETEKRLKRLLSWEETDHDFTPKETDRLIQAVDELKALDPACGSGAFPMGMLQKLVLVLQKLDPKNDRWRARQQKSADAIESAPAREEARRAIQRAFAKDNDDFGRKLFLIENCLYGVDIQPIACQIAKLRFFISLIVDQAIDPKEPNYGILALPNLETKIVAANTLLGLQRGQLSLESQLVKELESKLRRVRHEYFTARSYKRKKELREEDRRLSKELASELKSSGEATPADSTRLASWNPYDLNSSADFFDPAWMFAIEPNEDSLGAFHVVIGNPPYVRQEELKARTAMGSDGKEHPLKDVLKQQYECYTGTSDLYVYFFERSFQLMKTGGVLSFVTSNKYFKANYGERLRMYLYYSTRPLVALDFGDAPVFTSVAYPCILVAEKRRTVNKAQLPPPVERTSVEDEKWYQHMEKEEKRWFETWQARVMTWQPGPEIDEFPRIFDERAYTIAHRELKPDGWRLESPANLRLLERIRSAGTPLGEYVQGRFYYGIKTGLNDAFVVDRVTRDRLIKEDKSSKEVLKPFLRGRDVKRWRVEFAEQYLIKIESSENVGHPWSDKSEKDAEYAFAKTYPAIHDFFRSLKKEMVKRQDQGKYYWELRSCDYWQEFEQEKVVFGRFMIGPTYAFDDTGIYHNDALYFASRVKRYLAAILNSEVNWYFLSQLSTDLQNGYLQALRQYQEQIPIPAVQQWQSAIFDSLVKIVSDLATPTSETFGKVSPLALSHFEDWINALVYELYFGDELNARKLSFFSLTAQLKLPEMISVAAKGQTDTIARLFERTFDSQSEMRSKLYSLRSVDSIRIIKSAGESSIEESTAQEKKSSANGRI